MGRDPKLARLALAASLGLALPGCAGAPSGPAPEPLYRELTGADARTADRARQRGLETLVSGTMTSWSDPDRFASGTVMPLRTFRTTSGLFCREFEELIAIKGAVDRYRLVGCRSPDGVWRPAVTPAGGATRVAAGG